MGWIRSRIRYYRPDGSPHLIMEAFGGKLSWEGSKGCKYDVMKASAVKNVIYAAVKVSQPGKDPVVLATVHLTKKDGEFIMVKHQAETVGPINYDCPASILNLLTPIEDIYAQEWRSKCWEKAMRKRLLRRLSPGSQIEYAPNTDFSRVLVLVKWRNRRYWVLENKRSIYIKTSTILQDGFDVLKER